MRHTFNYYFGNCEINYYEQVVLERSNTAEVAILIHAGERLGKWRDLGGFTSAWAFCYYSFFIYLGR